MQQNNAIPFKITLDKHLSNTTANVVHAITIVHYDDEYVICGENVMYCRKETTNVIWMFFFAKGFCRQNIGLISMK